MKISSGWENELQLCLLAILCTNDMKSTSGALRNILIYLIFDLILLLSRLNCCLGCPLSHNRALAHYFITPN